jgi:hypothetical protein
MELMRNSIILFNGAVFLIPPAAPWRISHHVPVEQVHREHRAIAMGFEMCKALFQVDSRKTEVPMDMVSHWTYSIRKLLRAYVCPNSY